MKIDCQECGARILAEDLHLPTSMAKCRNCNAVFSFAPRVQSAAVDKVERLRPPRPDGLQIHEMSVAPTEPGYRDAPRDRTTLVIVRRWFSPLFIFLAFFCMAWDGFLFFWYSNLVGAPGAVTVIAGLFPIVHVAVGVGLTYYTIAGFFNRTTFRLDERNLSVRHGPLPWKGNCVLPRDDIKQLYCEHEVSRGKNGPSHSYYLSAVRMNQQKVRLGSMPVAQAKYIEDILEERLGIGDMRVPGEAGPNESGGI